MKFEVTANQPFIVKHRNLENTGIVFADVANAASWNEITKSRYLDPLAILSVFYTHWDFIKSQLAEIFHIQDLNSPKLHCLAAFLDNTTPYRDEQSNEVRNPLPLKLFSPKLVNDRLTFSVGLYSDQKSSKSKIEDQSESQKVYSNFPLTYSIAELQQSFINSQCQVLENLELLYELRTKALYLTFQKEKKYFKEGLDSPLDQVDLNEVKLEEIVPPFFAMLWKTISNQTDVAGLLRAKILVGFYDQILKKHTTYLQQTTIEGIFTQKNVRNVLASVFNSAVKLSPEDSSLEAQLKFDSILPPYSPEAVSAICTFKFLLESRLISADYLVSIYDELIKKETNAYLIYLLVESVARVIKATAVSHSFEKKYLDGYLEKCEMVLYNFEHRIEEAYRTGKESTHSTQDCIIDPQADKSLALLKYSPQAWEALFNSMKIELALQHAINGYPVQLQKGFTVTEVFMNGTNEYVVGYLSPMGNAASFKIKNTKELGSFLKGLTDQEYEKIKEERIVKTSRPLQAGLPALFAEGSAKLWAAHDDLKLLGDRLKTIVRANDSPLNVTEKRSLVVSLLIGQALANPSLMTYIGTLLKTITGQDENTYFITGSDLLNKITHYRTTGMAELVRIERKAELILELRRLAVLELDPLWFLNQESFNDQMCTGSLTDKQLSSNTGPEDKARSLMLRPKVKLVQTNFPSALGERYHLQQDDIRLKISLCFYEALLETEPMAFFLEGIAYKLMRNGGKIYPKIVLEGLIFQALAQARVYLVGGNDHQRYALLLQSASLLNEIEKVTNSVFNTGYAGAYGLGSVTFTQEQKRMKELLDETELAILTKDIIPQYRAVQQARQIQILDAHHHHSPPGSHANSTLSNTSVDIKHKDKHKNKKKREIHLQSNGSASLMVGGFNSNSSSSSSSSSSSNVHSISSRSPRSDSYKNEMVPLSYDPDDISEVKESPVGGPDITVEEIIEVPKKITYEKENSAAVEALEQFRKPAHYAQAQAAIQSYKQAVKEVETWLTNQYLMESNQQQWDNYKKFHETNTMALTHQKDEIRRALAGHFSLVDERFEEAVQSEHEKLIDITELGDQIRGVRFGPFEKAIAGLQEKARQITERLKKLQDELNEERSQNATAALAVNAAGNQIITQQSTQLIPGLLHFEYHLQNYSKIHFGTLKTGVLHFYAQHVNHTGNLHTGRQLSDSEKALAELLRATVRLRYSLMRLQSNPPAIYSCEFDYQQLKDQLAADRKELARYYAYNPIKSSARKALENKIAAQERELEVYHKAAGSASIFSVAQMKHHFHSVTDPELLLWMGMKVFAESCSTYYESLARKDQQLKLLACQLSINEFFTKYDNCVDFISLPAFMSQFVISYNAARVQPKPVGSVLDNCLKFIFEGVRPTQSAATQNRLSLSKDDDLSSSQLNLIIQGKTHDRNSQTPGGIFRQKLD